MTALRAFLFCLLFTTLWWTVVVSQPPENCGSCEQLIEQKCVQISDNCVPCALDTGCGPDNCYFCHPLRLECTEIPGCTPCKDSLLDCGGCGVCTVAGRCASLDESCEACDKEKPCTGPCQKCSNPEGPGKCEQKLDCKPCGNGDDNCPPCQTCKDNVCQLNKKPGNCTPCGNENDETWCPPCYFCNGRNECERNGTCTPCKVNGDCDACDVCNDGKCERDEACQVCATSKDCTDPCQTCDEESGTCMIDPKCKPCKTVDDCDGPCQACLEGECLTINCKMEESSSSGANGPSKAAWVIFSIGMCVVIVVVGLYVWREVKRNMSPIRSIGNQYDVVNRSA